MRNLAVSKKQQACVNRYMAQHYDRINLTVAKGGKDIIKAAADRVGVSVNAYINAAISEKLRSDGYDVRRSATENVKETE